MNPSTPTQTCPQCGCDMHRSHPKRNGKNIIMYYRRWTCTACPHYEAGTIRIGFQNGQRSISLVEREELANRAADSYYPKGVALLKTQWFKRNTKEL